MGAQFIPYSVADDVLPNKGKRRNRMAIYAIVCPIDGGVRYVGVTSKSLDKRLKFHLKDPTNPAMSAWFAYLKAQAMRPLIKPLEFVSSSEWEDAERGWIHWFRQRGRLLNVDPGGEYRVDGKPREITFGEYQPPVVVQSTPEPLKPPPGMLTGRIWNEIKGANKKRAASQSTKYGRFGGIL